MSWTAPKTWTAGELVTMETLNREVRDNLKDLDARVEEGRQLPIKAALAAAGVAACASKRPVSRRALLFPWRRS